MKDVSDDCDCGMEVKGDHTAVCVLYNHRGVDCVLIVLRDS